MIDANENRFYDSLLKAHLQCLLKAQLLCWTAAACCASNSFPDWSKENDQNNWLWHSLSRAGLKLKQHTVQNWQELPVARNCVPLPRMRLV
jgi:hypothetical protein